MPNHIDVPATLFAVAIIALCYAGPAFMNTVGVVAGSYLRRKTEGRRAQLLAAMAAEERAFAKEKESGAGRPSTDSNGWENVEATSEKSGGSGEKQKNEPPRDWSGIVGFFHPFCNAGGGGERVLWAAIRATQERYPGALCVVYTGDHDVTKQAILARVKDRFNIDLHPPSLVLMYLSTRHLALASYWPHFTLLGQSLGSMVMAWDAFQLVVPDIFIDTMGYAFALGLSKLFFGPSVPTAAYVHYPTISTDMLESLDPNSPLGSRGVNAGQGTGLRGLVKRWYWLMFARLYARVGATVDVVMTNSTWTQAHVDRLWGPRRRARVAAAGNSNVTVAPPSVVYPPCAVEELEQAVDVSQESEEKSRQKVIIYIAQFRPEKNHTLILKAFSEFLKTAKEEVTKYGSDLPRLVLLGSVRDDADSKRVYELRLLVNELGIKDNVQFHLDASWPEILDWLRKASVGVNGMWNEHFGIGVVEYQAAGLISVVHDSGGPKLDIVTEVDGQPTGFHATTAVEFAQGFDKALSLEDPLAVRLRARRSARRFTEEEFAKKWTAEMDTLVAITA